MTPFHNAIDAHETKSQLKMHTLQTARSQNPNDIAKAKQSDIKPIQTAAMQTSLCSSNKSSRRRRQKTDGARNVGRGGNINLACNLPHTLAGSRLPALLILSVYLTAGVRLSVRDLMKRSSHYRACQGGRGGGSLHNEGPSNYGGP